MDPGGVNAEEHARAKWLLPSELMAVAASGAALFALTGQSVIWVLGGVLGAAAICRVARARDAPHAPSARIRRIGQLLIGAAIGPGIAVQDLTVSAGQLLLLAAGVIAIIAASLLVARLYARHGRVDGLTAGLATLPGGIGIMPSVAAEHGRRPGLVAVVQAFRMTLVLVLALLVLALSGQGVDGVQPLPTPLLPAPSARAWLYLAALLGGSVAAAWLAGRLRVPVPTLLGPLFYSCVLALLLRSLGAETALLTTPFLLEVIGQTLLGITIGEYLAQRRRAEPAALIGGFLAVIATCALGLVIALAITAIGPWSFLVAFLMVAPGGAPEMVVIASALGGDLAFVLAAQTGRQVLVNAGMPLWLRLFPRFDPTRRP